MSRRRKGTDVTPETKSDAGESEEIWGYGIHHVPSGFVAVRLSTLGQVFSISPLRGGKIHGEAKWIAEKRLQEAQLRDFMFGKPAVGPE